MSQASTARPQVNDIGADLVEITDRLARLLQIPGERRDAGTYERLAELHRREAGYWKAYLESTTSRVAWMAAAAAADRARMLARRAELTAITLLQDSGQLVPAEQVTKAAV